MVAKRLGLVEAIHPNHKTEPTGATGLHSGESILDHHRPLRGNLQAARCEEKRVRRRLAGKTELRGDYAIDLSVEEVVDTRRSQYGATVGAR